MPVLPPLGRDTDLPGRFMRLLELWREIIRPVPTMIQREGSPQGVQVAERGTFYLDTVAANLYVKTDESRDTGWKLMTCCVTPGSMSDQ